MMGKNIQGLFLFVFIFGIMNIYTHDCDNNYITDLGTIFKYAPGFPGYLSYINDLNQNRRVEWTYQEFHSKINELDTGWDFVSDLW
jgi:hypothetical protein